MSYPMVRWQAIVFTNAGHSAKGAMEAVAIARDLAKSGFFNGARFPFTVFHTNEIAYRYDASGVVVGDPNSLPQLLEQEKFSPATADFMGDWIPIQNRPNQWRVSWLASGSHVNAALSRDVARAMWETLVSDPMPKGNNEFVAEFHQPWERPGWKPINVQWIVGFDQDGTSATKPFGVSDDTRWFPLSTWPEEE